MRTKAADKSNRPEMPLPREAPEVEEVVVEDVVEDVEVAPGVVL